MKAIGIALLALTAMVSVVGCTNAVGQGGGQAGSGLQPPLPPPGLTVDQAGAYCSRLAQLYGQYVGSVGGYLGGVTTGGEGADLDTRVAIANCQDGNYAAGIPVLQEKLRDARVTVPPPPNAG